jgi:hypothetical protein
LFAVLAAVLLHPAAVAGLAYAGGTLDTLAGADLANLGKVRRRRPRGLDRRRRHLRWRLLTGIIAVLLAALL